MRDVLFDEIDRDLFESYSWYKHKGKKTYYARTNKNPKKYFHRLLMKAKNGQIIDHINGNGLDNRRSNLRLCDKFQNARNSVKKPGLNRYKGVHKQHNAPKDKPFVARISVNRKSIHLGYFKKEIEAALAYNKAAIMFFGEFANLNNVEENLK